MGASPPRPRLHRYGSPGEAGVPTGVRADADGARSDHATRHSPASGDQRIGAWVHWDSGLRLRTKEYEMATRDEIVIWRHIEAGLRDIDPDVLRRVDPDGDFARDLATLDKLRGTPPATGAAG